MHNRRKPPFRKFMSQTTVGLTLFGLGTMAIIATGIAGAAPSQQHFEPAPIIHHQPEPAADSMVYDLAQSTPRPRERGGRPGKPPKEAFAVCEKVKQDAKCTFADPRRNRQIDGTCLTSPRGDKVCVPDNAPPQRQGSLRILQFA